MFAGRNREEPPPKRRFSLIIRVYITAQATGWSNRSSLFGHALIELQPGENLSCTAVGWAETGTEWILSFRIGLRLRLRVGLRIGFLKIGQVTTLFPITLAGGDLHRELPAPCSEIDELAGLQFAEKLHRHSSVWTFPMAKEPGMSQGNLSPRLHCNISVRNHSVLLRDRGAGWSISPASKPGCVVYPWVVD